MGKSQKDIPSVIIQKELHTLRQRPLFDIEASSLCNIRCKFCPRDRIGQVSNGLMDRETMALVSEWIPENSSGIICGLGEPLLNRDLEFLVGKLRSRSVSVSVITNGILLDRVRFESLRASGAGEIQVSLHTLDAKRYEEAVGNGFREKIMENLESLASEHEGIRIRINSVTDLSDEEENHIVEYCRKNGFVPFLRNMHSRGGLLYGPEVKRTGCGIFASTTFVTYGGNILRYCNNRTGKPLANILDRTFRDVLAIKEDILVKEQEPRSAGIATMLSDGRSWTISAYTNLTKLKKR